MASLDSRDKHSIEFVVDQVQRAGGYAAFVARTLVATADDLQQLIGVLDAAVARLQELASNGRKDG